MRNCINNTRGAAGVMLCMLLLCLMMVAGLLVGALCLHSAGTTLGRASYLGAQSLLAEYDRHLFEDYGLFAVRTDEETGAQTIRRYVGTAADLKGEADRLDLLGLNDIDVSLDLKSGSLIALEHFENQLKADMKYKAILDALGMSPENKELQQLLTESQTKRSEGKATMLLAEDTARAAEQTQTAGIQETPEQEEEGEQDENRQKARRTIEEVKTVVGDDVRRTVSTNQQTDERVLRNKAVIEALPTRIAGVKNGWFSKVLAGGDLIKDIFSGENVDFYNFEDMAGDLITGAYVNEYILKYCRNKQSGDWNKETFFQNEAEYVLYGNLKDAENAKAFKEQLITLRTALNLIHIYSDSEKNQLVNALAASAFPGPGAAAAALVIATAWAAAEAAEDAKTLDDGGKVPLLKTRQTWQLSWENLLSGTKANREGQEIRTGLDYKGYLRLFLLGVSRENKLLRMMDIIQINIKGRYYKDFTITSCYTGFEVTTKSKARAIGPVLTKGGVPWVSVTSEHAY